MIIYFSATGNSKYVAQEISKRTDDEILSIVKLYDENKHHLDLTGEEYFGVITPTYFGGLPKIVEEYLSKIEIDGNPYVYVVSTYGTGSGASTKIVEKKLNKRTNAKFSLQMPDTWTPSFDLSTPEKIAKFTKTQKRTFKQ